MGIGLRYTLTIDAQITYGDPLVDYTNRGERGTEELAVWGCPAIPSPQRAQRSLWPQPNAALQQNLWVISAVDRGTVGFLQAWLERSMLGIASQYTKSEVGGRRSEASKETGFLSISDFRPPT